jgi:hypothetical protein
VKRRWRVLASSVATALALGAAPAGAARPEAIGSLEVYYTNPVLVRAGEHVLMPVDVVCATADGNPCTATVALDTRAGDSEAWHVTNVGAMPGLTFDLSGPASRAVGSYSSGSVSFYLKAEGAGGASASLPDLGASFPLNFYVTKDLPVLTVPTIPFGQVRRGTTALFLPWGSGRMRAGLVPGAESATLGPPSFDVDGSGTIYLADAVQGRLAMFARGHLIRETGLTAGVRPAIAVAEDGAVFVADSSGALATVRRIDPAGIVGGSSVIGSGLVSEVRAIGEEACVRLLPLDAWFRVDSAGEPDDVQHAPTTGRPLDSGSSLIRVGWQGSVRLGYVTGDDVTDAVELSSAQHLGEVALAEPDGTGGFWVVVHVWQVGPAPADQFQVLHVASGEIVASFAVADQRFADTPPLSRFRAGGDGNLYQMTTSPEGMRIVRYDLEEES